MPDPQDESGYTKPQDGLTLPRKQPPALAASWDDEDVEGRIAHRPECATLILIAGALSTLIGLALLVALGVIRLVQAPFEWLELIGLLYALAFIYAGAQLLRGKHRDPKRYVTVILLPSLVAVGLAAQALVSGDVVWFIIAACSGALLLAPTILVFLGRRQYLAWKAARERGPTRAYLADRTGGGSGTGEGRALPREPTPDTPEGWVVEDLDHYRFLIDRAPPRPGCFLRTLKGDLQSLFVLGIWAKAGGAVGVGLALSWGGFEVGGMWLALPGLALVLLGARLAFFLLGRFFACVQKLRHGPVFRGEVCALRPHPLNAPNYSTAEARLADGRVLLVALPTAPAAAFLDRDGRAEVLLVATPDFQEGHVIGIRAVPRERGEGEAAEPER
jgi:hypothetical protein